MPPTTDNSPTIDDPLGMWVAACPACGHSFDIAEIGYQRTNAYSLGLRRSITCPKCHATHGMKLQHVDRHGVPDQPLSYVLRKVFLLHAKFWGSLLLVAVAALLGVVTLVKLLGS